MATATRAQRTATAGADRPGAALDAGERRLLEVLRGCARGAQRGPRLDIDQGCALADPPPAEAAAAWGAALLRALDVAATRPLAFHPRGAASVAFGEAWTLRLVLALAARDMASALFLLGRGVRRERRRQVLWLAGRLADAVATGKTGPADLDIPARASPAPASAPCPLRGSRP